MYIQNRNRFTDIENKPVHRSVEGRGEGQVKDMGLTDTNNYIENRYKDYIQGLV